MSYESARAAVAAFLGPVYRLPMLFDGNSLCPGCVWRAMNVAGGWWVCWHCGFSCRATVLLDTQGARWLKLVDMGGE